MSADAFALARRVLEHISEDYGPDCDVVEVFSLARLALTLAELGEVLERHERPAHTIDWSTPSPGSAGYIEGERTAAARGDAVTLDPKAVEASGHFEPGAVAWDAEAIEATLRRAEAEGLRVRITWHPDSRRVTRLRHEQSWEATDGVPWSRNEAWWVVDEHGFEGWRFHVGSPKPNVPGIIAAEIIDEQDAKQQAEAQGAPGYIRVTFDKDGSTEITTHDEPYDGPDMRGEPEPWAAPDGWERKGRNLADAEGAECTASSTHIWFRGTCVRTSLVRDYLTRESQVSSDGETITPLSDIEALLVDSDRDVAIVPNAVLRSQIAWLDREGER